MDVKISNRLQLNLRIKNVRGHSCFNYRKKLFLNNVEFHISHFRVLGDFSFKHDRVKVQL